MPGRVRNRTIMNSDGYSKGAINGTELDFLRQLTNSVVYDEHCSDETGSPGLSHDFALTRYEATPDMIKPLNGLQPSGSFSGSGYVNYRPEWKIATGTHLGVPDSSNIVVEDFVSVRARTNPSRPVITPLVMIQNFAELPKMLKNIVRIAKSPKKLLSAREIASQNLGTQFGWLPLIDDIHKMLDMQKHVNRRVNELHRIYSNSGLRRRIRLGSWNVESTQSRVGITSVLGSTCYVDIKQQTNVEKWATIRWKPTVLPDQFPTYDRMYRQAVDIALGLTSEGLISGAWDVLPWSWLADWFTRTGDYMLQNSNTVPAEASDVHIMRQVSTVSTISLHPDTPSWVDGGAGYTTVVSKLRQNSSSLVGATMPFIGLRRLSILGSLFLQRLK